MPQITTEYLLFGLVFALSARLCSPRLWPWMRDAVSLGFVLWWDWRSAGMLIGLGLLAWGGGRASSGRDKTGRAFWAGLLLLGLGFLSVRVAQRLDGAGMLLAPLGFGFAVLRLAHYWIEQDAGSLPPHGPMQVLGWLLYFPTVLIGPVQRFDDWLRWERRRRWDEGDAAWGLRRVLHGYGVVVVISFWAIGGHAPALLLAWPASAAGALVGGLTLYLTFSGLSSVAIGLGRLGGQRVPENFNAPLLATSLPDFWRRWHMTVTEWCRAYVYLPMLAKTRSAWTSAGAAMAVFALWHELSLACLGWGLWQGLGLALWHRLAPRSLSPAQRPLGWVLTMGWVFGGFWLLRVWPRGGVWIAR